MSIKNNIELLQAELKPFGARLIAVSKTQAIEKIKEAYDAGQRLFGENKVQEMLSKYEHLPADAEWHLIGHLQRNKVKYIVPFVAMIHSVDSFRLLEEINKQAEKNNRVIACLLQVHIAEEESKFGFSADELIELIKSDDLANLNHVNIVGLMGMATFTDDKEQVRKEFAGLKLLFDRVKSLSNNANVNMQELSMGMSGDYQIALAQGSTLVRIGTAVFGERTYH
ncbi:MAG TPA: YggS family pyridoxal phosphate-dependent enzyme [Cyclobacteriaceae bacterium]|nr:YggS family pyridoxal phosphate-dependent enzyme [Cyclobacteriaceae bacterium]